jgi:hypothetical protein
MLNWIYTAEMARLNYDKIIKALNDAVISELAKNFQQHKITNALIDNIETVTTETVEGFIQDYLIAKYGAYLNFGVRKERIPFSPGSGAKRSLYIEGLIRYVQMRKGISDMKRAKSIAFAIAHTQKHIGMPINTKGEGTHWIARASETIEEKLTAILGEMAGFVVMDIEDLAQKWTTLLTK